MSIVYKTHELIEHAIKIAEKYEPKKPPLLVGSTVWLGSGADIDVVVLCDTLHLLQGLPCVDGIYADAAFRAYRHGDVNVIVVEDPVIYGGWEHATKIMMDTCPTDKAERVAMCMALRAEGESLCR